MVHLLGTSALFSAVKRLIWVANSREILDGSCSYCKPAEPGHSNKFLKD